MVILLSFMLKVLSIISLIVAAQAFFLCIHFFFKKKATRILNRILSFLCFAFALLTFNTYLSLSKTIVGNSFIQDIANNVMWFVGPCLYLYTIYKDKIPNKKVIVLNLMPYVIPAIIDIFFNWNWFSQNIVIVAFIQMCTYLFLSITYVVSNYSKSSEYYNWILPSLAAFTILVVVNFSLRVLGMNGIELLSNPARQSFTTLFVVPIFFLAYKEMNSTNDFGIQPKKYKTTPISKEKSEAYLSTIKSALEDKKMYLDTSLKLSSFASETGIPSKYISQLINQNLNLSFTEYITQLRIEDAKSRLKDPKKQHLTISGIAEESGFASSSRFNHLFKKHTGLTPTQYQKQGL